MTPLAPNADTLDCALAVIDLKLASATLQRDRAIEAAVRSLLLHNEGSQQAALTRAQAMTDQIDSLLERRNLLAAEAT